MRLPVIFLAIVAVSAFAACGGGGDNSSGSLACSPSPRPTPQVGTRANPVPICATLTTGDGWEITVLSTTPDGTAQVMAANQFDSTPVYGDQFFIATVQAKRTGTTAAIFAATSVLRSVGRTTDRDYSTFNNYCGVVPDKFLTTEPFPGEVVQGNVCWAVDSRDAPSLEMYYDPGPQLDQYQFGYPPIAASRPADGYMALH